MMYNGQTCTDYVKKNGRPHYPMEIQENIMTPIYESDIDLC